ncbi:MAG: sugar phosphate isomerase/epimerase family protein [Candidatus Borkfalkia sp.]
MKLELDVFWLAVAGIRATDYIKEQRERLVYLHIKELGENAESVNPVVGEGRADIENVLKLGREMNVEWSILEVEKVGVPVEEYLARSYEFMKKYQ